MLPPALKLSLKPVLKICKHFSSHLPWLGQVIQQRCGLAYSFLLPASQREMWYQSSTISFTSAEVSSADKYHRHFSGLFKVCVQ